MSFIFIFGCSGFLVDRLGKLGGFYEINECFGCLT